MSRYDLNARDNPKLYARAEEIILARMAKGPFRFADLYRAADAALAAERGELSAYRLADRLIQRERKAGRITKGSKNGDWVSLATIHPTKDQ